MTRAEMFVMAGMLVQVVGFGGTILLLYFKVARGVGELVTKVETMWMWWQDHDERQSSLIEAKVDHTVRAALQGFLFRAVPTQRGVSE